ncbi:Uncharacterised protein [BD1-7 clade bacterium]|uniref:Uncharacterized protein n=1 Tax=BD1-7 clade bacterium TaxID=2029982 RepID=A0A5S9PKS6_9GAMM|nr:Uncharacterised protein [BD1-7 clade bacterium]
MDAAIENKNPQSKPHKHVHPAHIYLNVFDNHHFTNCKRSRLSGLFTKIGIRGCLNLHFID